MSSVPARQQRHLDLPRDAQLFLQPLLLRRRQQQVLDAAGHLVERARQLAELILRRDVDAVREVALPHALGAHEELVDRARDRARERQAHHQRHELDDQKQDRDDDEDDAESAAEAAADAANLDRLRVRQALEQLAQPERQRHRRAKRGAGVPVVAVEEADRVGEQRQSCSCRSAAGRRRSRRVPVRVRRLSVTSPALTPVAAYSRFSIVAVERQVDDDPADRRRSAGRPD